MFRVLAQWSAGLALAFSAVQGPSSEAKEYLDRFLEIVEQNSIKRNHDFKKLRANAYAAIKDAKTTADTYPAIISALSALADKHSFLMDPARTATVTSGRNKSVGMTCHEGSVIQVREGSPAYKAGIRQRMTVFSVNGKAPSEKESWAQLIGMAIRKGDPFDVRAGFDQRRAKNYSLLPSESPLAFEPQGWVIDGRIGYVCVPAFQGSSDDSTAFAMAIQSRLAAADRRKLDGWIVDLRTNMGGNMYPMIAGLGPLLGERILGSFVRLDGNLPWRYEMGAAMMGSMRIAEVKSPVKLKRSDRPIAVLTSNLTGSSGEATLISFLGDSRVRTFGLPTYGVPTANQGFRLSDGATLLLCVSIEADRTGKTYDSAIPPDVMIAQDWKLFQSDRDPTILAAVKWISEKAP